MNPNPWPQKKPKDPWIKPWTTPKHPGDPWVTWWEISITSYEPPLEPWVVYPSEIRKKKRTCRHERLKRRLTRFPHDVIEPFRDVGPLGLETTQNAWETVRNYLRSWSPAEHVFNIDSTCFCWLNIFVILVEFHIFVGKSPPRKKGKGSTHVQASSKSLMNSCLRWNKFRS